MKQPNMLSTRQGQGRKLQGFGQFQLGTDQLCRLRGGNCRRRRRRRRRGGGNDDPSEPPFPVIVDPNPPDTDLPLPPG